MANAIDSCNSFPSKFVSKRLYSSGGVWLTLGCFFLLGVLANVALGEDTYPPGFAGANNSGAVFWEFSANSDQPTSYYYIPDLTTPQFGFRYYGGAFTWNSGGGISSDGSVSVNPEESVVQKIPSGTGANFTAQVQITYKGSTGEPWGMELWNGYPGSYLGGTEGGAFTSVSQNTVGLGGGWMHLTWSGTWLNFPGNATHFHMISFNGGSLELDEVVVDMVVHDGSPPTGPGRPVAHPCGPSNVSPTNNEEHVDYRNLALDWSVEGGCDPCATYDVYFGTSSPPSLQASDLSVTEWDTPSLLSMNQWYYWQIDANVPGDVQIESSEWRFKTGGKAYDPVPADSSTAVSIATDLSWTGDTFASSYDVYFGTSPSPPYITNVNGSNYDPPGDLNEATTYYWRIDQRDAGDAVLMAGDEWNFTTYDPNLGFWTAPVVLPVAGTHMILLRTGKVIIFEHQHGAGATAAYLFDTNDPLDGTMVNAPYNYLCSGHAVLENGWLLVNGGESEAGIGIYETGYFDPVTESWGQFDNMNRPRWYPSTIILGDGDVITIGGISTEFGFDPTIERYTTDANSWTLEGGQDVPWQGNEAYNRIHLMSDGQIFMGAQLPDSYIYDANAKTWTFVDTTNFGLDREESPTVRLLDGRILNFGGAWRAEGSRQGTVTTEVIDPEVVSPTWQYVASLNSPRWLHDGILLPDGKVLCVGGKGGITGDSILEPELYDPVADTWTVLTPHQIKHNYHSTASILPDGRVIVSGGDMVGGLEQWSGEEQLEMEIFSPPYLFAGDRPVVQSAPSAVAYGTQMRVYYSSTDPIASVVLLRPGSTTHSFTYNQIGVPVSFTDNGSQLTVSIPSNTNLLPPGYYLLFILSNKGVPCVAPFIQLTTDIPVAGVIYVDKSATGANDGTSWADAYTDMQDGLGAAGTGDQIWVAKGTYKPTSGSSRTATFTLKNNVALYGGFEGDETVRGNRDWASNETILSGDIGIIDDPNDNSYHVVTGSATDPNAILDGFTITAGNADGGGYYDNGGGMYNYNNSSPTIANCTFSGNSAVDGGGMFNTDSSPTVTNCTFSQNSAASAGGGMFNINGSNPILTNCTFTGNSSVPYEGGGMFNTGSSPTITNCTFSGNSAVGQYGYGGGMFNEDSGTTVTNSTFTGNSAINGGGMYNCVQSNSTVTNCTFSGNTADVAGGAIYCSDSRVFIAHSISEFSDTQGRDNWYYGYYISPYTPGTFQQLDTYDGERELWYDSLLDPDYPLIWDSGGIPGFDEWAVRRWVSEVAGEVRISGHIANSNDPCYQCGDGATGHIIVDGSEEWNQYVSGDQSEWIDYSIIVNVGIGDTVDFAIDPNGDTNWCDQTYFPAYVSQIPPAEYPEIDNCIFWDNTAPQGPQVALVDSDVQFTYCDVQGGQAAIYSQDSTIDWGNGNIEADPNFVRNPDDGGDGWGDDPCTPADESENDDYGDLHLLPGSPCVDAGDNSAVPETVTTDIDGDPRIADGDDGDETATVDMGSDELMWAGAEGVNPNDTVMLNPGGGANDPNEEALVFFENTSEEQADITVTEMASDMHAGQSSFQVAGSTLMIETSLSAGEFLMTLVVPFTADDLDALNPLLLDLKYYNTDISDWELAVESNTGGPGSRWVEKEPDDPAPSLETLVSRPLGDYGVYWNGDMEAGFVWANVDHVSDFSVVSHWAGDLEPDTDVDAADFAKLAARWQDTDCALENYYCDGADVNGDGDVNLDDVVEIVANWLAGR